MCVCDCVSVRVYFFCDIIFSDAALIVPKTTQQNFCSLFSCWLNETIKERAFEFGIKFRLCFKTIKALLLTDLLTCVIISMRKSMVFVVVVVVVFHIVIIIMCRVAVSVII